MYEQKKINVAVVLNARNEEENISATLQHLTDQHLVPYRILVIDDGSTDNTAKIALNYDVELIRRNPHDNYVARKELAETVNSGLEKLDNDEKCDYILLMSGEILLSKNYISTIVSRMENDPKLVVAAGVVKNEFAAVPRGPGRIVRYDFWKKLGLRYPVNYGFEGYLLWKAMSLGYKIKSFDDVVSDTVRKTGSSYEPERYYYYGLGLKALGYSFLYAMARIVLFEKRKPKGAFHMLRGYLSKYDELYEKELRDFVRKNQNENILHFNKGYLSRLITTIRRTN